MKSEFSEASVITSWPGNQSIVFFPLGGICTVIHWYLQTLYLFTMSIFNVLHLPTVTEQRQTGNTTSHLGCSRLMSLERNFKNNASSAGCAVCLFLTKRLKSTLCCHLWSSNFPTKELHSCQIIESIIKKETMSMYIFFLKQLLRILIDYLNRSFVSLCLKKHSISFGPLLHQAPYIIVWSRHSNDSSAAQLCATKSSSQQEAGLSPPRMIILQLRCVSIRHSFSFIFPFFPSANSWRTEACAGCLHWRPRARVCFCCRTLLVLSPPTACWQACLCVCMDDTFSRVGLSTQTAFF